MELKIVRVMYEDLEKDPRFAEKLRGFLGNKYIDNDLLHNHEGDKLIYRYPMVQYKVINKKPVIIGINQGAKIVKEIAVNDDELIIDDVLVESFQRSIDSETIEFGVTDDYVEYEFLTPWLALNQKNSSEYNTANNIKREEILKRMIIGNIISLSRGVNYQVDKQLNCWVSLEERCVTFKNIKRKGFVGKFKVNFKLPNYIGIGKSVSHGFGTIKHV